MKVYCCGPFKGAREKNFITKTSGMLYSVSFTNTIGGFGEMASAVNTEPPMLIRFCPFCGTKLIAGFI
jgi:hypothetical protein